MALMCLFEGMPHSFNYFNGLNDTNKKKFWTKFLGFHNKKDPISCSHPGRPGVPWASPSPTEAIPGTPHRQDTAGQLVCVRDQGNSGHSESDTEPGRDPLHRSYK